LYFQFYFAKGSGVKKLRNKNKSGFTLIELLVVIAIIGLLASVVLLALNSARSKSRDAKRLADIRQFASAMELYFNDQNTYPTTATAGLLVPGQILGYPNITPTYIGLIPSAPSPQDGTCTGAVNGGNAYYMYANNNGANLVTGYTITFCLGAVTGGYSAGPHTLTPAGIQ
jgi:prepilin-type N-terminal cleavage/methylation domain-containing protein